MASKTSKFKTAGLICLTLAALAGMWRAIYDGKDGLAVLILVCLIVFAVCCMED